MSKRQFTIAILILSLLCFLKSELKADDTQRNIYTPRGTLVGDSYETDEFTYGTTREYWDDYYASAYPNATQLTLWDEEYSSSRRYNCHGYAWHMIGDDDINDPVWIGYYDYGQTYKYWEDESYSEVAVQYASIVDYSGDHSATTTGQTDIYISKWNMYPLMRHHKNYHPGYGNPVKFLRKNPLVPQDYATIHDGINAAVPGQTVHVSSGAYTETATLTIPDDVTLELASGTTVRFANGTQLMVNGNLDASNTTFTTSSSSWKGIKFNSGSDGDLLTAISCMSRPVPPTSPSTMPRLPSNTTL